MRIPIGKDDFKILIEGGFYFVDKSLFIRDIIEDDASVILILRPRRFGKSVNFSMLRYFLEKTTDVGDSQAHLFQNLKISQVSDCMSHQGQYPVISLSFKELKASNFELFIEKARFFLSKLYQQNDFLLEKGILKEIEEKRFRQILLEESNFSSLENALLNLSDYLHRAYGKKVMILIDEYDAPLHEGYRNLYYDEIVDFTRNFLGAALKGNPHLEKGVLTGILRVSRESIFSELNNIFVYSILQEEYSQSFGFTEKETEEILTKFGLAESLPQVKDWYNGYLIGDEVIYNPWSILSFLHTKNHPLKPYWINTSSNELARDLILGKTLEFQEDLERLLQEGSIEKEVKENLVLRDLAYTPDAVWSLLLFSGYLKPLRLIEGEWRDFYVLEIPNKEVRRSFYQSINTWLERQVGPKLLQGLLKSLTEEKIPLFAQKLQELVKSVLSYYDTGVKTVEAVYHSFVLGLLVYLEGRYRVTSNRESGLGRYDIMLHPKDLRDSGMIFEFKAIAEDEDKLKETMEEALQQIQTKDYATELRAGDVKKILGIGVVFKGKIVHVDSIQLPS